MMRSSSAKQNNQALSNRVQGEPIIISLYSHKGGVGKTTCNLNLSYLLSEIKKNEGSNQQGYRVLMVDGDPQCSLSAACIDLPASESPRVAGGNNISNDRRKTKIHEYIDQYKKEHNIYSCFDYLFNRSIERRDPLTEINRAVERIEVTQPYDDNPNLFLLPGHRDFHLLETSINKELSGDVLYQGTSAGICYGIRQIAKKVKANIVFIDLNPGATGLNFAMLLGSDYFAVPIMPDHYSYQAIYSLSRLLPDWERKFSEVCRRSQTESVTSTVFPKNPPKFLGMAPQCVPMSKEVVHRIPGRWLNDIFDEMEKSLCPSLHQAGMINLDTFQKYTKISVQKIKTSLIHKSETRLPVVALDEKSVDSIRNNYQSLLYSLLNNFNSKDRERIFLNEFFRIKGTRLRAEQAQGEKVSIKVNSSSRQDQFTIALPVPINKLKYILTTNSQNQSFREAVMYECMNYEHDYFEKTCLAQCPQLFPIRFEVDDCITEVYLSFEKLIQSRKYASENVRRQCLEFNEDYQNGSYFELREKVSYLMTQRLAESDELEQEVKSQLDALSKALSDLVTKLLSDEFYEFFSVKWAEHKDFFINEDPQKYETRLLIQILETLDASLHIQTTLLNSNVHNTMINQEGRNLVKVCLDQRADSRVYRVESVAPEFAMHLEQMKSLDATIEDIVQYRASWKSYKDVKVAGQVSSEPISVAVFNHKGGVGKTTCSHNIACMLGKGDRNNPPKRVLVIDADTQCNSSSMFMGNEYRHFLASQGLDDDSKMKQTFQILNEIIVNGKVPNHFNRRMNFDIDDVRLYDTKFDNVFLLPGSTQSFVDVEVTLSKHFREKGAVTYQFYEVASNIFREIAKRYSIDVIIIDMCPSISAVNKMLLMNADKIYVPTLADYSSLMAVQALPDITRDWAVDLFDYALSAGNPIDQIKMPKFTDLIPVKYDCKKLGKATEDHLYYLNKMKHFISTGFKEDLVKVRDWPVRLNDANTRQTVLKKLASMVEGAFRMVLGIPHHASYGLDAQMQHLPIVLIDFEDRVDRTMKITDFRRKFRLYNERFKEIVLPLQRQADERLSLSAPSSGNSSTQQVSPQTGAQAFPRATSSSMGSPVLFSSSVNAIASSKPTDNTRDDHAEVSSGQAANILSAINSGGGGRRRKGRKRSAQELMDEHDAESRTYKKDT